MARVKNQVTKNAVEGDPLDTSVPDAVENMTVSKPIATEEPNTARQYIAGVEKIKNIVNKSAIETNPNERVPMNGFQKSDINESISLTDAINTLFEGSELSEDFKEKLTTIFEAAVKEKTYELIENLEEHYNATIEEELDALSEQLIESIDEKLDYMAEIWINENQLAVDNGIKMELFENFIGGMKTLFQESYVDIPEERYDVVSDMAEAVDMLKTQLNEQIEINYELNGRLKESLLENTINNIGEDLSDNQKQKLKFLTENLEFDSEEQLIKKLTILKESSFPTHKNTYSILEEDVSGVDYEYLTDTMSKYVSAL